MRYHYQEIEKMATQIVKYWRSDCELSYTLLAPKSKITYESERCEELAELDYFSHRRIKKYEHV